MNLKLVNRGETGELLLEGRLDYNAALESEAIFEEMTGRFENLVLNMEKLEYISSAGLRIVKKLYMTMNKKGGTLALSHVPASVMEVFEMTGFAGFLKFI